jgi:hypothetical protein
VVAYKFQKKKVGMKNKHQMVNPGFSKEGNRIWGRGKVEISS